MSVDTGDAPLQGVNALVGLVLSAQLEILDTFLPMGCWLVAVHENDQAEIVSAIGEQAAIADLLVACLSNQWPRHVHESGFNCRPVSQMELDSLRATGYSGRPPAHAFRALLHGSQGQLSGMVLGCSWQASSAEPAFNGLAREIELCLRVISRTLTLYMALTASEKLVYETQRRAQIDPLTQVLNRAGWNRRLRNVAATGVEVAVGLLDLDYLKFVNDSQGHLAGDVLLRSTARAIKSVLRANDSVARLGGDEFAVLLFDVTPSAVEELRERLRRVLVESEVAASIGMALRSESGSLANAMQLADTRMYQEKRSKQRPRTAGINAHDFK